MLNMIARAHLNLNKAIFANAEVDPFPCWASKLNAPDDQYVLRMLVKTPDTNGYVIPPELEWLRKAITDLDVVQNKLFVPHPFVYVTARVGEVRSTTDDVWHVDGFSMRFPHAPEQDYIYTAENAPTEWLDQRFEIPADFDPFKHNIHHFFQDRADESKVKRFLPEMFYAVDPYIVHRRPTQLADRRVMVRVSHIPIEIEDDTCTQNPLLPTKVYGRTDIRTKLVRY